ncbi:hypothetical protein SUDANB180_06566 [Streptomyces sp. enrichment culture]
MQETGSPRFECAGPVLLRASALPTPRESAARPGDDGAPLSRADEYGDAEMRRQVTELASVPAFMAAVELARLVTNNLHTVRDGRLTLVDFHSASGDKLAPSVRHTSVVRTVLRAAREPVSWYALTRAVRDRFPQVDDEAIERCLEQLVGGRFLLTDVEPPTDCGCPLTHLLDRLDGLDHPVVAKLRGVRKALRTFDAAKPEARSASFARLPRTLHGTVRHGPDRAGPGSPRRRARARPAPCPGPRGETRRPWTPCGTYWTC